MQASVAPHCTERASKAAWPNNVRPPQGPSSSCSSSSSSSSSSPSHSPHVSYSSSSSSYSSSVSSLIFLLLILLLIFFVFEPLTGDEVCSANSQLASKGGRIRPATSKEGHHDTTRRDNFTRVVRGARPSAQALLGGARVLSHTPRCTGLHRSTPAGDNSSANKRGRAVLGSPPRVSMQLDPKLLPGSNASQAGDGRRVSPLAFTLSPLAAS